MTTEVLLYEIVTLDKQYIHLPLGSVELLHILWNFSFMTLDKKSGCIMIYEFLFIGEYKVKVCQTEVEIKFSTSQLYTTFIRCFQMRYPTSSWSKYLQRDCCQIYTDDGKSLTLHLWEDIATIWVSEAPSVGGYRNYLGK